MQSSMMVGQKSVRPNGIDYGLGIPKIYSCDKIYVHFIIMDLIQDTTSLSNKKTFLSHVFSSTEDGQAELMNVAQYSVMGIIPVVILNKIVQRFIPDADSDKSTLEIAFEIVLQLIIMFCGIVIIHRAITYVPTYSGFKYDSLSLTNVILAFLVVVLSIQTKLGLKVNILFDRAVDLWNGTSSNNEESKVRVKNVRYSQPVATHSPSQADYMDHPGVQTDVFPPAPAATSAPRSSGAYDMPPVDFGPMAANSLLGSNFGAF